MAIFKGFGRRKRRKYPIKLDEKGKSARSRCFEMFGDNTPSNEIAKIVGVKIETVRRYHQQWKKNPNFEGQHAYFKEH
jgi:transposase